MGSPAAVVTETSARVSTPAELHGATLIAPYEVTSAITGRAETGTTGQPVTRAATDAPSHAPAPILAQRPPSLKAVVRKALDWETVTPLDELPLNTLSARVKKGLRWWREEVKK